MQNHSAIGVKTLKFDLRDCDDVDLFYVDRWLHNAFTPGIEELTLLLPPYSKTEYSFPCSLLSNGSGNSVGYLHLSDCSLRPRVGLSCLRSLTRVRLYSVRITGDELECFLSNSFALEQLNLLYCHEIVYLKIPRLSQRLSFLRVTECKRLQSIESAAPNLSTFHFDGDLVHISLGDSLQVKNLKILCFYRANIVCYARTMLVSTAPNVETLTICSPRETVNTPMLPGKFPHLKHLHISFMRVGFPPLYDYFSLLSFLDASPSLETFTLAVTLWRIEHASIFDEPSNLREKTGHRHDNLKSVKITGFCSDKSMIEFTRHIAENTTSLEDLTLDTTYGGARCSVNKSGRCRPMDSDVVMEAHRALLAVKTYIEGNVPSMVKLNVLGPCSRCHTVEV